MRPVARAHEPKRRAAVLLVMVLAGGCTQIIGLPEYSLCGPVGAGGCGGAGGGTPDGGSDGPG